MKKIALLSAVIGAALIAGYVHADDTPTTMPTDSTPKSEKKDRGKAVRLIKPYSELKDLTPEQREKISKIHADAVAAKKKIDDQEDEDEMGVLTDDQKAEVKKVQDEDKMQMKEHRKGATSKPAM